MKRLAKLGMVSAAPGMAALDMNTAEDAVVHHTREVVEGFVLCGMEVTSYYPLSACCLMLCSQCDKVTAVVMAVRPAGDLTSLPAF